MYKDTATHTAIRECALRGCVFIHTYIPIFVGVCSYVYIFSLFACRGSTTALLPKRTCSSCCVYTCVCVCVCVCKYTCTYICYFYMLREHDAFAAVAHMLELLWVCMYLCVRVCLHICVYANIYVYMQTYVYMYIHKRYIEGARSSSCRYGTAHSQAAAYIYTYTSMCVCVCVCMYTYSSFTSSGSMTLLLP